MIRQSGNDVIIEVKVKPNSKRFTITKKGDQLILEVTSHPKEGKANAEIIKGLERKFGKEVEIVKGMKGKDKIILVKNAEMKGVVSLIRGE